MQSYRSSCLFVVAPDVVGQAQATLEKYQYWGPKLRRDGWPVAFVAQDGQENLPFPASFDALFIGGSTAWKMSEAALMCIKRAQMLGKWVHVGRVNSQLRIAHFQLASVNSVDGTSLCFAPTKNFRRLNRQLAQRPLLCL